MDVKRSSAITHDAAERLQWGRITLGDLLIWTIFNRPTDYPDLYIARPFSSAQAAPLNVHLEHPTLAGIRELLPQGLTRLARSPGDDPVIVETWC